MNTNFIVIDLTRRGFEPKSTISVADAQSAQQLILLNATDNLICNLYYNKPELQLIK